MEFSKTNNLLKKNFECYVLKLSEIIPIDMMKLDITKMVYLKEIFENIIQFLKNMHTIKF